MSRDPWWLPFDAHRQEIDRLDDAELAGHQERFALEAAALFRGGDIDACV